MRCPDCGADYPVKPEIIVKPEPCKCGLTSEARVTSTFVRTIGVCAVLIVLAMGSCTAYQSYLNSTIAAKGDTIDSNGTLRKMLK